MKKELTAEAQRSAEFAEKIILKIGVLGANTAPKTPN
jgi:hypothetical protein